MFSCLSFCGEVAVLLMVFVVGLTDKMVKMAILSICCCENR